eukprot:g22664.t1
MAKVQEEFWLLRDAMEECDGSEGSDHPEDGSPEIVAEFPLDGQATSLGWDGLSQRIVVAVNGATSDRLCFCDAGDESLEDVSLPSGARALDLSFFSEAERRKSWVAVACSDGAVRLLDASPQRAASVVKTSYAHGVAATAVAISREGKFLASGSSSGHVVLQPFHGSGPTPLPGMLEADEAGIEALSCWRRVISKAISRFGMLRLCATAAAFLLPIEVLCEVYPSPPRTQIQQVSVESGISSLSYHSGGYLLASGTCDGSVLIFDLRMLVTKKTPAEPLQRFLAHCDDGGMVRALAFATEDVKLSKQAFSPAAASGQLGTSYVRLRFGGMSPTGDPVKTFLQDKVPSYATIESMMDRLSKRVSASASGDVLTPPGDQSDIRTQAWLAEQNLGSRMI